MKRPDFSLAEAVAWFLADKAADVEDTTLATYRTWLAAFLHELGPRATLRDLTLDAADRFARTTTNRNTRANKIITLRSFGTYLAQRRLWHDGSEDLRLSVLRDLRLPPRDHDGQAPYTEAQARAILRAAYFGDTPRRYRAVVALELHGLRGKEARCLLLANLTAPAFDEGGHIRIESTGTKRHTRGARDVPIEPDAMAAITDYLRLERPKWVAQSSKNLHGEPLVLADDGRDFTRSGWNAMAQRIRTAVKRETGIEFRQHRLRSTSVRQKQEADWPDSAIIQVHGWSPASGQKMLRRYGNEISTRKLKTYAPALGRIFGSRAK